MVMWSTLPSTPQELPASDALLHSFPCEAVEAAGTRVCPTTPAARLWTREEVRERDSNLTAYREVQLEAVETSRELCLGDGDHDCCGIAARRRRYEL